MFEADMHKASLLLNFILPPMPDNLLYLPPDECRELSDTLEQLLHAYLQQAFDLGTNTLEAMRIYENTRSLITLLGHGHRWGRPSGDQAKAVDGRCAALLWPAARQAQSAALSVP